MVWGLPAFNRYAARSPGLGAHRFEPLVISGPRRAGKRPGARRSGPFVVPRIRRVAGASQGEAMRAPGFVRACPREGAYRSRPGVQDEEGPAGWDTMTGAPPHRAFLMFWGLLLEADPGTDRDPGGDGDGDMDLV